MDLYQQVIFKSRYAKWNGERRENWKETVERYISYFRERNPSRDIPWDTLRDAIINLDVMPSMRALMTAGKALDRDNVAGFNCSYVTVDHPHVFDEVMYILMCGTGVGFSVERQYVQKLPKIAEEFHDVKVNIKVRDSRIGWATAFRQLISLIYSGQVPTWDLSSIRPAGAILKTFGGRASGPIPLENLFRFTVDLFKKAAGRRLSSLEAHDLMCKIAEIVIVGGVRRSALISLSNVSDDRMRHAKNGQWWVENGQRSLANNSAVYDEKPELSQFLAEMIALHESKSGERGIFSREAAQRQVAKSERRTGDYSFGTNPCSEIILRPQQFCNLSEVIVRPDDNLEDLKRKVELATILGTLQATLVNFRYLRKVWKNNTEEEALLGVSLTGIMDNPYTFVTDDYEGVAPLEQVLQVLKDHAIKVNKKYSRMLEINPSSSITCVKPSGTVSQLTNTSSGIHPRFAQYYIRRIRQDYKDPITKFLIDQGVPYETDVTNNNTCIFSFPIKSPKGCTTNSDVTAISQLNLWKIYQENWCEHKPSQTIFYTDDEFLSVCNWVYENFNIISGISFFPKVNTVYKQAPYEEITEDQYNKMIEELPKVIDWEELTNYEKQDYTTASHELACVGGQCEL